MAESTKSDYEIALARENSVQTSLQTLVAQAGETSKKQVALRDLESSAQTYRNLYDNFLQKFEETTQEQTFPVNNARIISPAPMPDKPSWAERGSSSSAARACLGSVSALLQRSFARCWAMASAHRTT